MIQINQHVEPSTQAGKLMKIKVGVDFQQTTGRNLMETAAKQIRIGQQASNTGQRGQEG